MAGRRLERMCDLQHAPIAAMPTDDLHADRQAARTEPGWYRDRRIRHERHVPARPHPIDVRQHGHAGGRRRIHRRDVEGLDLRDRQHEVLIFLATLRKRGVSKDLGGLGLSAQDDAPQCQDQWNAYLAAVAEEDNQMAYVADLVDEYMNECVPPEHDPDDPPPPPPPAWCPELSDDISEAMEYYYLLEQNVIAASGAYNFCMSQNG